MPVLLGYIFQYLSDGIIVYMSSTNATIISSCRIDLLTFMHYVHYMLLPVPFHSCFMWLKIVGSFLLTQKMGLNTSFERSKLDLLLA